jgi:hypothetical protein
LTGQEISLTVIAAILTLVGYSMNDTIVVFDRIRENLRLSRREPLPDRGQSQHQSDTEPDRADLGSYLSDRAFPLHFRRPGPEWLFICAGGGYSYRYVFFHRRGGSDVGGLAGMARAKSRATAVLPAARRTSLSFAGRCLDVTQASGLGNVFWARCCNVFGAVLHAMGPR